MRSQTRVHDPQGPFIQRWNKILLISCIVSVAVDSLFFYAPSIDGDNSCVYLDAKLEILASTLRSLADLFYLLRIVFQFRTGYIASSEVCGPRVLVQDARAIAKRYLTTYFLVDFLAVLPLPQALVLYSYVLPHLHGSEVMRIRIILTLIVICQYVPRLIRMTPLYLQITRSSGTIMETAWTGAAFNLLIYMIASHVLGALWYILSIRREDNCWRAACSSQDGCDLASLYCGSNASGFGNNTSFLQNACPTNGTDFPDLTFGIYLPAVQNVSQSTSFFEKLFYCFWWGLQNLCSCGQNLKTSPHILENLFAVFVSTSGLFLFALLIGNVQTYLQSSSVHVQEMHVRRRDTEQWMSHRLLPEYLKERILRHEQYRWQETQGVDEEGILAKLPKDLRRDIKRHLCLSLLTRVPMIRNMDDQLLDAMCNLLKPVLYTEGSCVVREGDPVAAMLFIMRGSLESATTNGGRTGFLNAGVLDAGDFCGEELVTWALDPGASASVLPGSTRTATTLSEVEAFALRAGDLRFVATQFRRLLHSKQLRHAFRFYSQQWRTWAACYVQAAWRRHRRRKAEEVVLREKERRLQAAIASGSSLSLRAAVYASRFAVNMLRIVRRNADQRSRRLREGGVPATMLQKPAEPNFFG